MVASDTPVHREISHRLPRGSKVTLCDGEPVERPGPVNGIQRDDRPPLADGLRELAARGVERRQALMHGDVVRVDVDGSLERLATSFTPGRVPRIAKGRDHSRDAFPCAVRRVEVLGGEIGHGQAVPGGHVMDPEAHRLDEVDGGGVAYRLARALGIPLSRLVADLYAADGIRCNAVTPGPARTEIWLDDPHTLCIHPGAEPLRGAASISVTFSCKLETRLKP